MKTPAANIPEDDMPDWVREKQLLKKVPVSRAWLYEIRSEGWLRFAILRRPGNIRGIVLYHLPTILAHLAKLADQKGRNERGGSMSDHSDGED